MNEFEKALAWCKANKTDDDVIVYAIGSGRIAPVIGKRKQQKKALDYISKLDGFVGFNPVDLWHTLILFDTLNNAKAGKNMIADKDIPVGNVMPILISKMYLKENESNR